MTTVLVLTVVAMMTMTRISPARLTRELKHEAPTTRAPYRKPEPLILNPTRSQATSLNTLQLRCNPWLWPHPHHERELQPVHTADYSSDF